MRSERPDRRTRARLRSCRTRAVSWLIQRGFDVSCSATTSRVATDVPGAPCDARQGAATGSSSAPCEPCHIHDARHPQSSAAGLAATARGVMKSPAARRSTIARRGIALVTLLAFVASIVTPTTARAQSAGTRDVSGQGPPTEVHTPIAATAPGAPLARASDLATTSDAHVAPGARGIPPADFEAAKAWLERVYGQAQEFGDDTEPARTASDGDLRAGVVAAGTSDARATPDESADAETARDLNRVAGPPSIPTYHAEDLPSASTSVVTGKTISLPTGAGTIQGMGESFSAELSTGIATYTVPFALPRARGDAQPSLSLSYSSSGGSGVAGVGWSLSVPFIARQTDRGAPLYKDQSAFHHDQDRFVFNGGQELVPICVVSGSTCSWKAPLTTAEVMPAWASGWQYFRPRVEGSYLRFFWSPDHLTWRVQSREGNSMEFGVPLNGANDHNALEENPDAPPSTEIYRWLLVRMYDSFGGANAATGLPSVVNRARYMYSSFGGTAKYLTDIYDTPAVTGNTGVATDAHHTHLLYEDRPDPTF